MQPEVGRIYNGTVKNITNYGAFINIQEEEQEPFMGMVHISEISRSFVSDIRSFLKEGDTVKVKVIGINEAGKVSLSMKQVEENQTGEGGNAAPNRPAPRTGGVPRPFHGNAASSGKSNAGGDGQQYVPRPRPQRRERPNVWDPKKKFSDEPLTFEDMLSRYKTNSEERMSDIKRNTERKNRSKRK